GSVIASLNEPMVPKKRTCCPSTTTNCPCRSNSTDWSPRRCTVTPFSVSAAVTWPRRARSVGAWSLAWPLRSVCVRSINCDTRLLFSVSIAYSLNPKLYFIFQRFSPLSGENRWKIALMPYFAYCLWQSIRRTRLLLRERVQGLQDRQQAVVLPLELAAQVLRGGGQPLTVAAPRLVCCKHEVDQH